MPMRYKLIHSLIITAEPYKRYSCLGCDNQGRRDWSITANLHVCEQSIELFFGMLEQLRVDWSGLGLHDCWHALNTIDMEGFHLNSIPIMWHENLGTLGPK